MTPKLSYRIWMSPRCGSSLFCEALSATNLAGRPGEYFNTDEPLIKHFGVSNYSSLKEKFWNDATSPNGVIGIKHSLIHRRYSAWVNELAQLRNLEPGEASEQAVWDDLFPNCRHIFICRRNKVHQAVSWWKAIQDNQWHLRPSETRKEKDEFYQDRYDFAALSTLVKQTVLREAAIQSYFDRNNIQAFTVVYEDFIENYEETVKDVLAFLGLPNDQVGQLPRAYKKTADNINAIWTQRFREEYQEGHERTW